MNVVKAALVFVVAYGAYLVLAWAQEAETVGRYERCLKIAEEKSCRPIIDERKF